MNKVQLSLRATLLGLCLPLVFISCKKNKDDEWVSQKLTVQPANNTSEYKLVLHGSSSWAQSDNFAMVICAWTNGPTFNNRTVIKFDLTSIPKDAVIESAKLSLYSLPEAPLNGNQVDPNFGTKNSFTVKQITADWVPANYNWNISLPLTNNNQVNVPVTDKSRLDLELDVKGMVANMVSSQKNYGFHFQLDNEETYNSRIFVGSYTTKFPDKRPKLEVNYKYKK